jgi:hypothetical protein
MIEYKGFKIFKASGYSGGYQIHKDSKLFSQFILISQNTCKKVIDTYLRRCGGEDIKLLEDEIKPKIKYIEPTIEKREVYLSEHEKHIDKLLSEK